eukprot:GHVN01005443.1.p1 GENE.GHVN01005443.1~~GHVN01005443.1.p1  ORF type:complete len:419 (-),score=17.17 GHVN01005443.1:853-2109(-)
MLRHALPFLLWFSVEAVGIKHTPDTNLSSTKKPGTFDKHANCERVAILPISVRRSWVENDEVVILLESSLNGELIPISVPDGNNDLVVEGAHNNEVLASGKLPANAISFYNQPFLLEPVDGLQLLIIHKRYSPEASASHKWVPTSCLMQVEGPYCEKPVAYGLQKALGTAHNRGVFEKHVAAAILAETRFPEEVPAGSVAYQQPLVYQQHPTEQEPVAEQPKTKKRLCTCGDQEFISKDHALFTHPELFIHRFGDTESPGKELCSHWQKRSQHEKNQEKRPRLPLATVRFKCRSSECRSRINVLACLPDQHLYCRVIALVSQGKHGFWEGIDVGWQPGYNLQAFKISSLSAFHEMTHNVWRDVVGVQDMRLFARTDADAYRLAISVPYSSRYGIPGKQGLFEAAQDIQAHENLSELAL